MMVSAMPDEIKCINFYGIETERASPVCSWSHPPDWYLSKLKQRIGINTVRIPFSYEYIAARDYSELDQLITAAENLNMTIILDWHRNTRTHQSASPETDITLDTWINAWIRLLRRYEDHPLIKGVGLFNEIQLTDPLYSNRVQFELLNALEEEFHDRFYYFVGCPRWGIDCSKVDFDDFAAWNRTFVDIHTYPFNTHPDEWDANMPHRIPPQQWFVGEFGWKQEDPTHVQWANQFISYLKQRGIRNACFWTIANSGDTGGLWKDDCNTFEWDKSKSFMQLWTQNPATRLRGREKASLNITAVDSVDDYPDGPH